MGVVKSLLRVAVYVGLVPDRSVSMSLPNDIYITHECFRIRVVCIQSGIIVLTYRAPGCWRRPPYYVLFILPVVAVRLDKRQCVRIRVPSEELGPYVCELFMGRHVVDGDSSDLNRLLPASSNMLGCVLPCRIAP